MHGHADADRRMIMRYGKAIKCREHLFFNAETVVRRGILLAWCRPCGAGRRRRHGERGATLKSILLSRGNMERARGGMHALRVTGVNYSTVGLDCCCSPWVPVPLSRETGRLPHVMRFGVAS
jgi:hypothetical protein